MKACRKKTHKRSQKTEKWTVQPGPFLLFSFISHHFAVLILVLSGLTKNKDNKANKAYLETQCVIKYNMSSWKNLYFFGFRSKKTRVGLQCFYVSLWKHEWEECRLKHTFISKRSRMVERTSNQMNFLKVLPHMSYQVQVCHGLLKSKSQHRANASKSLLWSSSFEFLLFEEQLFQSLQGCQKHSLSKSL